MAPAPRKVGPIWNRCSASWPHRGWATRRTRRRAPRAPRPRRRSMPDTRTLGQRQHDALITIARDALASGQLGQHNGLPVTVVLGATVTDFDKATGHAVTAAGSRVPMREVIRLASHAWWCL